jgi:hypothetical protein
MVEGYLRAYCSFRQHDWAKLLPMVEFAYNNSHHSSIGMSPFFANHGRNPTITGTPEKASLVPEAKEQGKIILTAQEEAQAALTLVKERDKVYFDRKHDEAKIGVGDKVWLSHEHIGTNRPSIKLSHKCLGPFEVEAAIGKNAFQLKLPSSIKVHPVFHASRLALWKPDQIPGRTSEPPPPITTPEGEEEYEVEEILDAKVDKGVLRYHVKWKGYDMSNNTWERKENLQNTKEAVEEFHCEHPLAPREVPQTRRSGRIKGLGADSVETDPVSTPPTSTLQPPNLPLPPCLCTQPATNTMPASTPGCAPLAPSEPQPCESQGRSTASPGCSRVPSPSSTTSSASTTTRTSRSISNGSKGQEGGSQGISTHGTPFIGTRASCPSARMPSSTSRTSTGCSKSPDASSLPPLLTVPRPQTPLTSPRSQRSST